MTESHTIVTVTNGLKCKAVKPIPFCGSGPIGLIELCCVTSLSLQGALTGYSKLISKGKPNKAQYQVVSKGRHRVHVKCYSVPSGQLTVSL